jgi:Protein of unknown function (DUF2911)
MNSQANLQTGSQGGSVKTRNLILLIVVTFALAFSASANNSKTLSFRTEVTLNGSKLPAGFYEVSWATHSPAATVTFIKTGQVMLKAMGKFVDRDVKYNTDAVVYTNNPDGTHTLLEIRFAGRKQALVFTGVN